MTVMVVDDSTEMRSLIRDLVAPWADEVYECGDGTECVARFGEVHPDWTVMDVRMPLLDGIGATRLIQTAHPGAKILLVTQTPSEAFFQAAVESGAAGLLAKDDLHRVPEFLQAHRSA